MSSSTLQLEFKQAMSDFKTMFPEMEDDVIEAVLRANQGVVDATIDQLLAMSTDNQNEKLRQEIEQIESTSSTNGIRSISSVKSIKISPSLKSQEKWKIPLLGPLPYNFLRIMPDNNEPDIEDEKLAQLLQNEELVAQLRINQEFMSTLDSEQSSSTHSDDDFKERLKNMGKLSRKKLSQLSRLLSTSSRKIPSPVRSSNNTTRLRDDDENSVD